MHTHVLSFVPMICPLEVGLEGGIEPSRNLTNKMKSLKVDRRLFTSVGLIYRIETVTKFMTSRRYNHPLFDEGVQGAHRDGVETRSQTLEECRGTGSLFSQLRTVVSREVLRSGRRKDQLLNNL